MQQRKNRTILGLLAVGLLTAACQDLQVDNPNEPDRLRAIRNPSDVENLISGTFPTLWNVMQGTASSTLMFSALGQEGTTTSQVGGIYLAATQRPAQPLLNDAQLNASTGPTGPVTAWLNLHRVVSNANDGLAAMDGGIDLGSPGNSARARFVALFNRGLAWGFLANGWDQATVLYEDTDFGTDANAVVRQNIRPSPQVLEAAIKSLDDAIAVAQATPFTIPATWYRTTANLTSAEMIRVANSYKARFTVYNARNPAERAAVNWQNILTWTGAGVTADWGPFVPTDTGILPTPGYIRQSQLNSANGLQQSRADYETIGAADVSGTWQTYLNTPLVQRKKILITTPDRRITGPTPTSDGSLFRYMSPALVGTDDTEGGRWGFLPDRGLYNFSAYQWFKYRGAGASAGGGAFSNIFVPLMSVTENNLLRAEALARTGNPAGAATLVNISRTRTQRIVALGGAFADYPGLPPVTATGVTDAADCVPRTRTGACGSLMDAIHYERRIELYGVDGMRAWVDNRGFGWLREGNPIHFPVPGRELEALGVPIYTYGGVGGNCAFGAACAPNYLNP
jgi:hypothetical protein